MALKFFYEKFSSPISNGNVFVNSSNSWVVVVGMSFEVTGGSGAINVVDEYGNAVADLARVVPLSESLSISGSDSFSSTASTTEGITSTTESIDESVSGLQFIVSVVFHRVLVPPGFAVFANYEASVYGFEAIQADSLEELSGFL